MAGALVRCIRCAMLWCDILCDIFETSFGVTAFVTYLRHLSLMTKMYGLLQVIIICTFT